MSKIETHKFARITMKNTVPPKLTHRLMIGKNAPVHDMDRGMVVVLAKLIENSLFETFQTSCIPTGSGREHASRYIKFAKYLLASINLLDSSQAIANHNLNVVASHIHAFLKLPGLFADRHEHCGAKRKRFKTFRSIEAIMITRKS